MKRGQFERVQLLLEQRRYALARQELEQALAQRSDDPLVHALLAHCLLDLDEPQQALEHAQECVGLAPDLGFCYYTLAIVLQEQGQLRQAKAHLQRALELEPEDPDYFVRLGLIFLLEARWQEALNCAEQALRLLPEHVDAINLRSMALLRLGQTDQAAHNLEQALQREPENARIHANRGWTQLHRGEHEAALHSFREALRLEPDQTWAREGMLEALKARYGLYRALQRYFFWMSRYGRKYQLLIMLGLIFGVRILTQFTGQYSEVLTYGLLLAYFFFALLTWLADPIFNLVLSFHHFGRYLLSPREKTGAKWTAGLLGTTGLSLGLAWFGQSWGLLLLAVLLFLLLVPVAGTYAARKPRGQRILGLYTLMLAGLALGTVGSYFWLSPELTILLGLSFGLGWLAYSWLANWLIFKA